MGELEEARSKGESGKEEVRRLEAEKSKVERTLRCLKAKLEDKEEAMELMEEQRVYFEEEIESYSRMVEESTAEMKELQVELQELKKSYHKLEAELAKKDGLIYKMPPQEEIKTSSLDKTFDKMQKDKLVRQQMKEFIDSSIVQDGMEESEEQREKRRATLRTVKRLMKLRNGYSAADSESKRHWNLLRKNMKRTSIIMQASKGNALFSVIRSKCVYTKQTKPQMHWQQIKDNLTVLANKMRLKSDLKNDEKDNKKDEKENKKDEKENH